MISEGTMATHYINNDEFLKALVQYRDDCAEAKKEGREDPQIPNYIGECFYKIADHLSRKPNFVMYSFKDEMVFDGVENCIMYFRNFDPEKSSNPFSYFTQIIYYAFLRRIMKEKKQMYIKYKMVEQFGILDGNEMYEDEEGNMQPFQIYDNISEFIENFEQSKNKKKNAKLKNLQKFMIDEDGDIIE